MGSESVRAADLRFERAGRIFRAGFSLPEILVVVGVIGVLAAVLIPTIRNVVESSEEGTAEANLEMINQAVLKYSHSVSELTNSVEGGFSDEQAVFSALKVRDTSVPGSPFLNSNLSVKESSDNTSYRAVWNGRMFQIIGPGTNGTGVDMTRFNRQ